ncbi:MAG: DUF2760 domain-containing protein [Planctomycetaceae bacterium]|nr:DUF2760 domain-containing protein [Planctomycetaceae bacterium]
MGRFWLGIAALFRVWFNGEVAQRVRTALEAPKVPEPAAVAPPPKPVELPKPVAPPKPKRSEALTLLATLQREARLIDFLKESLDSYSDAQVGGAVRNIHRDCGTVLERLFAMRPVLDQAEGATVTVPEKADAGRYRLTGRVTDAPHGAGTLVHHGWEATQCEIPQWTGSDASARIIAPAEVELR